MGGGHSGVRRPTWLEEGEKEVEASQACPEEVGERLATAGRGVGPDPGGSWESRKARERRDDTVPAQPQEAESGGAHRTVGGGRAGSQEAGEGAGGQLRGGRGAPKCPLSWRTPVLGKPLPPPPP